MPSLSFLPLSTAINLIVVFLFLSGNFHKRTGLDRCLPAGADSLRKCHPIYLLPCAHGFKHFLADADDRPISGCHATRADPFLVYFSPQLFIL